jgi:hypothetical protein
MTTFLSLRLADPTSAVTGKLSEPLQALPPRPHGHLQRLLHEFAENIGVSYICVCLLGEQQAVWVNRARQSRNLGVCLPVDHQAVEGVAGSQ